MSKKLLLISLLFLCSAFARSTTFDNRDSCEKSDGIWREFGSDCADECETKLEDFPICTNITTFSCGCGKSRCWSDDTKSCVALKEYKKIFDVRKAEEKRINEEAKKKREAAASVEQTTIINNLNNPPQPAPNPAPTPIIETPTSTPIPAATPEAILSQPTQDPAQPPSTEAASPQIPPFFLKKEQAKKELEEKIKAEAEKNKSNPQATPSETAAPGLPSLPVIPLPQ